MLRIRNLTVSTGGKRVVDGVSLTLKEGQIHVIMGPNGAGKSSLALALMGHPDFLAKGSIMLGREELIKSPADVRARKGMFLAFQDPKEVEGVKVSSLVRKALGAKEGGALDLDRMVRIQEGLVSDAGKLGLDKSFVSRELNVGFSGGEKKRLEMLQMMSLRPKVVIMDEVDSGLDVDGIRLISRAVSGLNDGKRCFLIITHYPRILRYLKPDFVHIIANGRLVKSGDAKLAQEVEESGYAAYVGKGRGTDAGRETSGGKDGRKAKGGG